MQKTTFNFLKFQEVRSFNDFINSITTNRMKFNHKKNKSYLSYKKKYGNNNKLYLSYIQKRRKGNVNKSVLLENKYIKLYVNDILDNLKKYNNIKHYLMLYKINYFDNFDASWNSKNKMFIQSSLQGHLNANLLLFKKFPIIGQVIYKQILNKNFKYNIFNKSKTSIQITYSPGYCNIYTTFTLFNNTINANKIYRNNIQTKIYTCAKNYTISKMYNIDDLFFPIKESIHLTILSQFYISTTCKFNQSTIDNIKEL